MLLHKENNRSQTRGKRLNTILYKFKDLNSKTIKGVPLPEAFPDRSKANLYEVIMTSLQVAKKWSHEGSRYFFIKYWYLS